MKDIIEVRGLSLTIGKTAILNDVTVSLEAGKIHGLIGRNGSGKTMLMKCICGFIRPTRGVVVVDGKRVGKDVDFPKNMGIIIETPGFIPYYSGYKNLKLLAGLRNKIGKEEIIQAMERTGLDPKLKRHVKKYSLGMILVEPMNGLDKDGVEDMRRYLIDLREQGKTILIASHSSEDISVLCDAVYEMEKGVLANR